MQQGKGTLNTGNVESDTKVTGQLARHMARAASRIVSLLVCMLKHPVNENRTVFGKCNPLRWSENSHQYESWSERFELRNAKYMHMQTKHHKNTAKRWPSTL